MSAISKLLFCSITDCCWQHCTVCSWFTGPHVPECDSCCILFDRDSVAAAYSTYSLLFICMECEATSFSISMMQIHSPFYSVIMQFMLVQFLHNTNPYFNAENGKININTAPPTREMLFIEIEFMNNRFLFEREQFECWNGFSLVNHIFVLRVVEFEWTWFFFFFCYLLTILFFFSLSGKKYFWVTLLSHQVNLLLVREFFLFCPYLYIWIAVEKLKHWTIRKYTQTFCRKAVW